MRKIQIRDVAKNRNRKTSALRHEKIQCILKNKFKRSCVSGALMTRDHDWYAAI